MNSSDTHATSSVTVTWASHPRPWETGSQLHSMGNLIGMFPPISSSPFCLDTLIKLCPTSRTVFWYEIWTFFHSYLPTPRSSSPSPWPKAGPWTRAPVTIELVTDCGPQMSAEDSARAPNQRAWMWPLWTGCMSQCVCVLLLWVLRGGSQWA